MKTTSFLSSATALTLLFTTSGATPTPAELFKRQPDSCGVSQFYDETSGGSPFWLDCLMIRNNLSGNGDWSINAWQERDIASWGSCKFRVRSNNNLGSVVGDTDVKDVIWDAINKFKRDNRIGARGRMECDKIFGSGRDGVNWWILHT